MRAELIKKIKNNFGLNIYETKVWLALLSKNTASVGEIAELSGVPRSRVYDVLESLEKKGFAVIKLGKPIKYLAVKPSVIIEKLKKQVMKEAEESVKLLEEVKNKEEFRELERLYVEGVKPLQIENISAALRGQSNINANLKELINQAKEEVILVTTTRGIIKKVNLLKSVIENIKRNKIRLFIGVSGNGNSYRIIENIVKQINFPIKRVNVEGKFCLIDRKKALFFLTDEEDENKEMAIFVESPFFTNSLITLMKPLLKH